MNQFKLFSIIAALSILIISCSTEVPLSSGYEEKAIVYGLLDPKAETNYIKITKGFFDAERGALETAKDYDSIYFDTTTLVVELQAKNENGTVMETIIMEPTTEITKEDGDFNSTSNTQSHILYKTDSSLSDEYIYHLKVWNTASDYIATAKTSLVEQTGDTVGSVDKVFLRNPYPAKGRKIHFEPSAEGSMDIQFEFPDSSVVMQCDVNVYISEIIDGNKSNTVVTYRLFKDYEKEKYSGPGNTFYSFIANSLDGSLNASRSLDSVGFKFTYGGEIIHTYQTISGAQTGLIQSQAIPAYSNIENGIGILSSISTAEYKFTDFSDKTIEELTSGSVTGSYGFTFTE